MILTIGDSVSWGQGILEEHNHMLARATGATFLRVAHSGATIGTRTNSGTEVEDGEIPIASPTLWQQTLGVRDWFQVDVVLVNGEINDVSLTRILSPWTSTSQLNQWVDQFCNHAMQDLLVEIAGRLIPPHARIAVLGYYPILSNQSAQSESEFQSLLEMYGVATTSVLAADSFSLRDVVPPVIQNCMAFWRSSEVAFRAAVDSVNATLGRRACVYVPLPFAEENVFLLPEDEVSCRRGSVCEALYGDLVHVPQWVQCVRASTGHPNVQGAAAIASTLDSVLGAQPLSS
jgi:hypothetical protein